MTTPVIQSDEGNGLVMHFFLPKNYSVQNAPLPESNSVEVVTIKRGFYAVLKYSGRSTIKNYEKHVALLKDVLNRDGAIMRSDPIMARFNGPFTPFFYAEMKQCIVWNENSLGLGLGLKICIM